MTPRTLAPALLFAASVVLVGCAASHAATPPSAAPSLDATGEVPIVQVLGGDCARILTSDALGILVGSAPAAESSAVADSPAALRCTWNGSARSLTVTALPAAEVPDDDVRRYSLPECAPDGEFCGGSASVGDIWMLVDFGWIEGEWEPIVSTALNAVQNSAAWD